MMLLVAWVPSFKYYCRLFCKILLYHCLYYYLQTPLLDEKYAFKSFYDYIVEALTVLVS